MLTCGGPAAGAEFRVRHPRPEPKRSVVRLRSPPWLQVSGLHGIEMQHDPAIAGATAQFVHAGRQAPLHVAQEPVAPVMSLANTWY